MSSKYGPRPMGSDGSDFRHRQKVAAHYRESVVNKFRLKFVLVLHVLLLIFMFLKAFEDILDQFEIDWGPLERLLVPTPHFWEYWWLLSVGPAFMAFSSMPKNNERRMRQSYYGVFLFGLVPIAAGAGHLLPTLFDYVRDKHSENVVHFLNFPLVVVEYAFFVVAFQIHAFTMYFQSQLIKSWQPVVVAKATPNDATDGHVQQQKSDPKKRN